MSQHSVDVRWRWVSVGIIGLAVLLRLILGLWPYSGAGDAPKYGDYEAQRHWMELAVNLPPRLWYTPSSFNNMSHWPLDYPPLSGYQSWLHGRVLEHLEPAAVAPIKSRGYETPSSKLIMRLTVVASDLVVYFPASLAAVAVFCAGRPPLHAAFTLAALLLQPALLLIDHAHFQYNCISLGLAAGAAAAIGGGWQRLGSALFCLSLNHKQMSLYFAPAFFAHLLGRCLQQRGGFRQVLAVMRLGAVVVVTFGVCWAPFVGSKQEVLQVVSRIFPIKRGLFEDYVANFWCATSLVVKWRSWFADSLMLRASMAATLLAAAPSMLHQVLRPSPDGLLLAMANSAFAFFMFAYQVHEKSILLPLLPVTLLAAREPALAFWLPLVASFSMYPLLIRDGAALPYLAMCALWAAAMWGAYRQLSSAPASELDGSSTTGTAPPAGASSTPAHATASAQRQATPSNASSSSSATTAFDSRRAGRSGRGFQGLAGAAAALHSALQRHHLVLLTWASVAAALRHGGAALVPPPARLPWLYDRLFITLAFAGHAAFALHLQLRQWDTPLQPLVPLAQASKPHRE